MLIPNYSMKEVVDHFLSENEWAHDYWWKPTLNGTFLFFRFKKICVKNKFVNFVESFLFLIFQMYNLTFLFVFL